MGDPKIMAKKPKLVRGEILLFPSKEWLHKKKSRLPQFKPHDLRQLIRDATEIPSDLGDLDVRVILACRRRNDTQLQTILHVLGCKESDPNKWQKAFFSLSTILFGVGHISWRPKRTNQNSAEWTGELELALLMKIEMLMRPERMSERKAIQHLVNQRVFPYRPQTGRHFSKMRENAKRCAALRQKLTDLKRRNRGGLATLFGAGSPEKSPIELLLERFDLLHSMPAELMEKLARNQRIQETEGS